MRISRYALVSIASFYTLISSAFAYAVTDLKINCGNLEKLEDEKGKYLLFHPTGTAIFQGNKISYTTYFTNKKRTPLSEQSRYLESVSYSGISKNRVEPIDFQYKFRNDSLQDRYYNATYLEFTISAKAPGQTAKSFKCIYKRD